MTTNLPAKSTSRGIQKAHTRIVPTSRGYRPVVVNPNVRKPVMMMPRRELAQVAEKQPVSQTPNRVILPPKIREMEPKEEEQSKPLIHKFRFINILNTEEFESSSALTPEFARFYKIFKDEMTEFLKKEFSATKIEIGRGHFDASGFFQLPDGRIFYISLSDVRGYRNLGWLAGTMFLIRTAKNFQDYTGGTNQFVSVKDDETFAKQFRDVIKHTPLNVPKQTITLFSNGNQILEQEGLGAEIRYSQYKSLEEARKHYQEAGYAVYVQEKP